MDKADAPDPGELSTDQLFQDCSTVLSTDAAWRRTLRRELSEPGVSGRSGAFVLAFIADGHLVRGADALSRLRVREEPS